MHNQGFYNSVESWVQKLRNGISQCDFPENFGELTVESETHNYYGEVRLIFKDPKINIEHLLEHFKYLMANEDWFSNQSVRYRADDKKITVIFDYRIQV